METIPTIAVPEEVLFNWQEIADLLADILEVPAALIMRVKEPYIEVFISSLSDGNPYHPGDREILKNSGLYCETVIKTDSRLLVPDALSDPAWAQNPDVKLNMISYLGLPIRAPDGRAFGTICVLDKKPNAYDPSVVTLLEKFRDLIESNLGLVHMNQILGSRNKKLDDVIKELQVLRGIVPICAECHSIRDDHDEWQPFNQYLRSEPGTELSHTICPTCRKKLYPDLSQ